MARKKKAGRSRAGEGSVYQRSSDGMWCATIELPRGEDGRRRRRTIVRKLRPDVVEAMKEAKNDLYEHGDLIGTGTMTLADWLEYWMEHILPSRNRPRTLANKRSHVDRWIVPKLGTKPLVKLSAADVRKFQEDVASATTPGAALDIVTTLRTALSDAVKEGGILRRSPAEAVDRPVADKSQRRALTLAEARRLLAYLSTREDRALWCTYLLTGARRGEVLGLEADRIGETVEFSWQLQRITDISKAPRTWEHRKVEGWKNLYLARPKSDSGWRKVPLVDPLRSIIEMHMQGRGGGFVFTEPDGRPITPESATTRWKDILSAAGIDGENVVLHSARHTMVDILDAAGVPKHIQRDIVGHRDERQTEGYRTKRDAERMAPALESTYRLVLGELTDSGQLG